MSKFTTLLEIARIPSATGQFDIVFDLVATDDRERFIGISKRDAKTDRAVTGMNVPLEGMETLAEIFNNIVEGMKVSV
jgi:hypothetical protein